MSTTLAVEALQKGTTSQQDLLAEGSGPLGQSSRRGATPSGRDRCHLWLLGNVDLDGWRGRLGVSLPWAGQVLVVRGAVAPEPTEFGVPVSQLNFNDR